MYLTIIFTALISGFTGYVLGRYQQYPYGTPKKALHINQGFLGDESAIYVRSKVAKKAGKAVYQQEIESLSFKVLKQQTIDNLKLKIISDSEETVDISIIEAIAINIRHQLKVELEVEAAYFDGLESWNISFRWGSGVNRVKYAYTFMKTELERTDTDPITSISRKIWLYMGVGVRNGLLTLGEATSP